VISDLVHGEVLGFPNSAFAQSILLTPPAGATVFGAGSWADRHPLDPLVGAGVTRRDSLASETRQNVGR
jgi:hypothetical protein